MMRLRQLGDGVIGRARALSARVAAERGRAGGVAMKAQATDERKLRESTLYICLRSEGDEWFGRTKLVHLLYLIDVEALRQIGRTISGQDYSKQGLVPVPARGPAAIEALEEAHDAVTRTRRVSCYPEERTFALREPDLDAFTPRELFLIESLLSRYRTSSPSSIGLVSRESVGWQVAEPGRRIPLGACLISDRSLTEAERAYALILRDTPELQEFLRTTDAA
jgi:hypothetical protein